MRTLLVLLIISVFIVPAKAQEYEYLASVSQINARYSPEKYDSLLSVWYKANIVESYDNFYKDFIDIDIDDISLSESSIPDSVYQARLRMIASVIALPYNDVVKKYIIAYTQKKNGTMRRIIGLAQYYMPLIEEELDRQQLPLELKILPIIESALNPKAISRAGAGGLWQFMLRTGKQYGLDVNSFVDDRFDPQQATVAACKYLKDLYAIYGDWTLVIAAYNCGPGNVNKALKRVPNAKTYWDIYYQLPKETRGYIPSFIAATYAYTFHKAHKIDPVTPPMPLSTDTVHVSKLLHFEQISSTLDIPIEVLRELNPQYKKDIIPAIDKSYKLVLPQYDLTSFIEHQDRIYAKDSIYLKEYLNPGNFKKETFAQQAENKTYKVKSGDNLGDIARKNGTSVASIKKLNKLKSNNIRIGQVLRLN